MNHLYEDKHGVIHACEGSRLVPSNPQTYCVWTKCEKDVPAARSFKSEERPTCEVCNAQD